MPVTPIDIDDGLAALLAGTLSPLNSDIVGPNLPAPISWGESVRSALQALLGRAEGTAINVREYPYSATGDGVDDDTAAIQAAINAAIAAGPGARVLLPPGTYSCADLVIANATDLTIEGHGGAVIEWQATGARIGLQLSGTCDNVTIRGIHFLGNGLVADAHAGVYNLSGAVLSAIKVLECVVEDCTLGISFNANTSGSILNCTAAFNVLRNIVGEASGYGYGLHVADGTGATTNTLLIGNSLDQCGRHSIYIARGFGVQAIGNRIDRHRDATTDGAARGAIVVARGGGHIVQGNVFTRPNNACIFADSGDIATETLSDVLIDGNVITDPIVSGFMIPLIYVGEDLTTPTDTIEGITITNNVIRTSGWSQNAIRVNWGQGITISNNRIRMEGVLATSHAVSLTARGESTSATYTDRVIVAHNDVVITDGGGGSSSCAFRLSTPLDDLATTALTFVANRASVPSNMFSVSAAIVNPNIHVTCQSTTGLSFSSGVAILGYNSYAAAASVSGDLTLTGSSSSIVLGSGTVAGDAQLRIVKPDTGSQSWATWRLASATGTYQWIGNHDSSENWNLMDSTAAVVFQLQRTGGYVRCTNGVRLGSTTGPLILQGTGSPEGVVTAGVGSLFVRTDGGAGTTLYVKESGAGNTGWVAK